MDIKKYTQYNSMKIVEKFIKENETFVFYGDKELAERIVKILKKRYQKNNFQFLQYNNGKIENFAPSDKIIIVSYHETFIANQLVEKYRFRYGENFIFFDHIWAVTELPNLIGAEFFNYFQANKEKFLQVYNSLSDTYSKKIFTKLINFRLNLLNFERLSLLDLPTSYETQIAYENNAKNFLSDLELIDDDQLKNHIAFALSLNSYSYFDIVTPSKCKSIINAGAYNTTSVAFSILSPNAKIYAFEPQRDIHKDNVALSKIFPNIVPLNYGVWSETKQISFMMNEDYQTASAISKEGDCVVDAISIDDFFEKYEVEKIDFIKMDIEGAELDALKGAKNVIQTQMPDLAISIYHKPEDLVLIPLYIKKLVPKYKIYIDHKYYNYTETLCFATIREQEH